MQGEKGWRGGKEEEEGDLAQRGFDLPVEQDTDWPLCV